MSVLQSIPGRAAGIEWRFAREAVTGFAYQTAGLALGFALNVVLARTLGAGGYGIYAFVVAVAAFGSTLGRMGLDKAALKLLPEYRVDGKPGLMRGLIEESKCLIAAISSALGVAVAAGLWTFWREPEHGHAALLAAVAALVPAMALLATGQANLRGLGELGRALRFDYLIRPLGIMAAVLLLWFDQRRSIAPWSALAVTLLVTLCGIALQDKWTTRALRAAYTGMRRPSHDWRRWRFLSFQLLGGSVFTMALSQSDLIVLGMIRSGAEVGYYNAASRMAALIGFGLSVLNIVAAPLIAELHSAQRRAELQRLLTLMVRAGGAIGLLLALGVTGLSPWILPAFGTGFRAAAAPLFILSAGQIVNVAAGPVGLLLIMTDHQGAAFRILMVVALLNLGLVIAGTLILGMLGAAAATAVTMILWNVAMIVYIRRRAGFLIVPLLGAFART